jgi:large subunit ribosomal protein L15
MGLDRLSLAAGARKRSKRVGRGPGSGHGKTSGKGHKGQKARSGGGKAGGFEGGQMPLYRRIPKRGFTPRVRLRYAVVNVEDLRGFTAGSTVDPDALAAARLIKQAERDRVKILGKGEVSHPLTIVAQKVSGAARQKIEAAGGRVELLSA